MIPKILHVAWIGEDGALPSACIDSWTAANPDFDVRIWGNEELARGTWRTRAQMKALLGSDLAAVMGVLRMEAVARHGGVAVDALSLSLRPIPDWLMEADAFALWADELDQPGRLGTALLGAGPEDLFFDTVLADIAEADPGDCDLAELAGGLGLTRAWRRTRHPLTVHPSHYLATTHGTQRSYRGGGIVLGELLRPARPTLPDESVALATPLPATSAPAMSTGPSFPDCVEGAPPLTASFTLPPLVAPDRDIEPEIGDAPEPTAPSWAEIAAGIRGVDEPAPGAHVQPRGAAQRFRLVVATDWASATVPLSILRAYAAMVPSDAPVDLVFAVPTTPGAEDEACVRVLLEGIEHARTAGILVESFQEVAAGGCFALIVPGADVGSLVVDVATFLTTMHEVALIVADPERLAATVPPVPGAADVLRRRLDKFRSVLVASA